MARALAVDLFCGLGGWTDGLIAEGWNVIGFDIEQHVYGEHRYPAQLVLQDVRTINGAQFDGASLIVASSPCQEFSYRAMPWKRAKALGPPLLGLELFAQAFRIQREAIAAAGHFIPMVQENVRGANPWVKAEFGRSRWSYGSYHLWGDVPALMPITMKVPPKRAMDDLKYGQRKLLHAHLPIGNGPFGRNDGTEDRITKNSGGSWFNVAHNTESGTGQNPDGWLGNNGRDEMFAEMRGPRGGKVRHDPRYPHLDPNTADSDGVKQPGIGGERTNGKGDAWFQDGAARHGSKSSARKAASARIAKIPEALARHIARTYYPTL